LQTVTSKKRRESKESAKTGTGGGEDRASPDFGRNRLVKREGDAIWSSEKRISQPRTLIVGYQPAEVAILERDMLNLCSVK